MLIQSWHHMQSSGVIRNLHKGWIQTVAGASSEQLMTES